MTSCLSAKGSLFRQQVAESQNAQPSEKLSI